MAHSKMFLLLLVTSRVLSFAVRLTQPEEDDHHSVVGCCVGCCCCCFVRHDIGNPWGDDYSCAEECCDRGCSCCTNCVDAIPILNCCCCCFADCQCGPTGFSIQDSCAKQCGLGCASCCSDCVTDCARDGSCCFKNADARVVPNSDFLSPIRVVDDDYYRAEGDCRATLTEETPSHGFMRLALASKASASTETGRSSTSAQLTQPLLAV